MDDFILQSDKENTLKLRHKHSENTVELASCRNNVTPSSHIYYQISPHLHESHQISLNLTKSHRVSSNPAKFQHISPNLTIGHGI